jgi:hypothetical protein
MAILRGFPPSNSIQEGIRIPKIVHTPMKIGELQSESRFTVNDSEYMILTNQDWRGPRAIMYKTAQEKNQTLIGSVYGFDKELEVVWLKEIW